MRNKADKRKREFKGGYYPTESVTGPPPAALTHQRPEQAPETTSPQDSNPPPSE